MGAGVSPQETWLPHSIGVLSRRMPKGFHRLVSFSVQLILAIHPKTTSKWDADFRSALNDIYTFDSENSVILCGTKHLMFSVKKQEFTIKLKSVKRLNAFGDTRCTVLLTLVFTGRMKGV